MFQGGGRLIAGKLTKELRRLYEKNKKYGRINPNDYVIVVCPKCLYASFPKDWSLLVGPDLDRMKSQSGDRKVNIEKIKSNCVFIWRESRIFSKPQQYFSRR